MIEQARAFRKQMEASIRASRDLLKQVEMTPEELLDLIDLYDDWENVAVGTQLVELTYYKYKDKLYQVILGKTHKKQLDWTPDVYKAGFNVVQPAGVIPEWVQPTGGHNAYKIGEQVTYKGKTWVSKINGNTTVPDGDIPHNRYWEEVK